MLNEFLDSHRADLTDLDDPFTEEEVWEVVKQLPSGKAPGPDGFTTEFFQACWTTVKTDVMAAFNKLHSMCGCGFQRLN